MVLAVRTQVRYAHVACLANDLRWLRVIDSLQVLLHSCVVVLLRVQVITKLPKNDVLLRSV
jgi:hypothetical protein